MTRVILSALIWAVTSIAAMAEVKIQEALDRLIQGDLTWPETTKPGIIAVDGGYTAK